MLAYHISLSHSLSQTVVWTWSEKTHSDSQLDNRSQYGNKAIQIDAKRFQTHFMTASVSNMRNVSSST